MTRLEDVEPLARTLLYEGYLLYPYDRAATKNRHRWTFGTLYPRAFAEAQREGDPWRLRLECLARAGAAASLEARLRFLHVAEAPLEGRVDVAPRSLAALGGRAETIPFTWGAGPDALVGTVEVGVGPTDDGAVVIALGVSNLTPCAVSSDDVPAARRDAALRFALASAHVIVKLHDGEFVPLVDPPAALRNAAARCRNEGVWPVLVGDPGARDLLLAAPIILEDYPRVAPESAGDFFDATEIDELLTLRVLTLTDDEKARMRAADPRAAALLERTERLSEPARRRLHGAARTPRPGSRVRLTPRPGGDVFDLALRGRTATVIGVERDFEGRVFVAVAVDDDPGRDLAVDGRPGHRFFFRPEDVEVLA